MFEPWSTTLCRDIARAVTAPAAPAPSADDGRDDVPDQILAALRRRRSRAFDLRTAAVIGPAGVEGRIRLRIDDGRWSLTTLEASLIALLLQVEPGVRFAATFADAFRMAAVQAERRVEAVHALTEGRAA